jgi:predicted XRE-type DNA-binding protein
MTQDTQVYASSGNVFADLGFENADEMLAKAELIRQITLIIQQQELTNPKVAELLNIEISSVEELLSGKLLNFSTDQLIMFLTILGKDIEIVVKDTSSNVGKVTVSSSN